MRGIVFLNGASEIYRWLTREFSNLRKPLAISHRSSSDSYIGSIGILFLPGENTGRGRGHTWRELGVASDFVPMGPEPFDGSFEPGIEVDLRLVAK